MTLSDNRDYKTLPNLQSQSSALAWEQTQMGPRSQVCFPLLSSKCFDETDKENGAARVD